MDLFPSPPPSFPSLPTSLPTSIPPQLLSLPIFPITLFISQLTQRFLTITTSSRLPPHGLPPFISSKGPASFLDRGMGRYGGLIRRAVLNSTSAGFATVCFAGCLTHHFHHTFVSPTQQPNNASKRTAHALRVSLLTCLTFVLLGGTFQSTSPSSLVSPGAFARSSIPAPSAAYATAREKRQLISLYRKYGCHTCGTKASLQVIGDHVPPTVVVKVSLR